jgi:hypothetical protein
MTETERFCRRQVEWYLKHGKYPKLRIKISGKGYPYVVGDTDWNRKHKQMFERVEPDIDS